MKSKFMCSRNNNLLDQSSHSFPERENAIDVLVLDKVVEFYCQNL